MIGVIANAEELRVAEEFFQLFKTAWEPYREGGSYEVILCGVEAAAAVSATKLKVVFGAAGESADGWGVLRAAPVPPASCVSICGEEVPLYTPATLLRRGDAPGANGSDAALCIRLREDTATVVRLGYNLWTEVEHLLGPGQPAALAAIPALDRHIQVLRRLMWEAGVRVVEIPAAPSGKPFICCLTHDIDFLYLRQHRFDRTMAGFLFRATLGSMLDWSSGRKSAGEMGRNLVAALQMPLVQMGVAEDYWEPFSRYLAVERGKPSTFFLIPVKDRAGSPCGRNDHAKRGVRYDVTEIPRYVRMVREAGCEVALHGIDAWSDVGAAQEEAGRISSVTGEAPAGVRMHWLYYGEQSNELLDRAGFEYESTSGYNEAIGYKAGTTQVFRPLSSARMLELPMHIQDCAMFFPDRMNLRPQEAWERCDRLRAHAKEAGGVITLNWHDRSLVPERLWGSFYERLIERFEADGAWFATAKQAAAWFAKRRQATFERVAVDGETARVSLRGVPERSEHDLQVRVSWQNSAGELRTVEMPIHGRRELQIFLVPGKLGDEPRRGLAIPAAETQQQFVLVD